MIRYVISSNRRYAPASLPRLLPTLLSQIEPERIVIAIGESAATDIAVRDGILTLLVTHNSFDYTGPIALLEHGLTSDWWFWLHDTCEAGPEFRARVEGSFDPAKVMTGAGWHSLGMPFANLGLYSQQAFETARTDLLALKDCTKQQACEGDGVVWRANGGQGALYGAAQVHGVGAGDAYGTGTLRMRSHLPDIDLYKLQANFGQGGWNVDL